MSSDDADNLLPWLKLVAAGRLNPNTNGQVFAYDFGIAETGDPQLRSTMMYHLGVWLNRSHYENFSIVAPCPPDRGVQELHSTAQYVLFGDRQAYEDFHKWMRRYSARFLREPMTSVYLPKMPSSGTAVRLHYIQSKFAMRIDWSYMEYRPTEELFEMWCWIDEQTTGKVWCASDGVFAFSKATDAVAFKLVWG